MNGIQKRGGGAMISARQADFERARLGAYDQMRRHDLGEWPRKILDFILWGTFASEQTRMEIRSLTWLAAGAGLPSKVAASIGLGELKRWDVLDIAPWPLLRGKASSAIAGVNVLFSGWNAPENPAYKVARQVLLGLEEAENLREAMRQCFVEDSFVQIREGKVLVSVTHRTAVRPDVSAPVGHALPGPDVDKAVRGGESSACPESGGSPVATGRLQSPSGPDSDCDGSVAENITVGKAERPSTGVLRLEPFRNITLPNETLAVSPQTPLVQEDQVQGELSEEQRKREYHRRTTRARARTVMLNVTLPPARATWAEVAHYKERLRSWVGTEDLEKNSRLWVEKMIYRYPDAVAATLERAENMVKRGLLAFFPNAVKDAGRLPGTDHRIKWLVVAIAREAGVSHWADVVPALAPIQ